MKKLNLAFYNGYKYVILMLMQMNELTFVYHNSNFIKSSYLDYNISLIACQSNST